MVWGTLCYCMTNPALLYKQTLHYCSVNPVLLYSQQTLCYCEQLVHVFGLLFHQVSTLTVP